MMDNLPKITECEHYEFKFALSDFDKYKYLKPESKKRIAKILPIYPNKYFDFRLINGSCAIANALNRVIKSELDNCPSMYLEYTKIETDCNNVRYATDFIAKIISCIRLNYDVPNDSVFTIDVKNTTTLNMDITSDHIIDKKTGKHPEWIGFRNIPLFTLQPGTKFRINEITIVRGQGSEDGRFRIADQIVYLPNDKKDGAFISVKTRGNTIDPVRLMVLACESIVSRLQAVIDTLQYMIDNSKHTYKNIEISYTKDVCTIKINRETVTISKLIITVLRLYMNTKVEIKDNVYQNYIQKSVHKQPIDLISQFYVSIDIYGNPSMIVNGAKKSIEIMNHIKLQFQDQMNPTDIKLKSMIDRFNPKDKK